MKIGFTWRKKFEIWIRSKDTLIQVFHSSVHSFIHSFFLFFFSLSQQLEKSSETAFDLSALDPPRLLLPSPSPRRARAILHSFDERCYPCPSPPHLGFSITTTTTRSLRSLRLKARFTARVPRPRFHCARERIILPHRSPLFPFRFPPLSSVQRIKRRKGASTASNRRIFQFLEKLFNFHPFDEFRPNLSFMLHEVILIWIEL